MPTWNMMMMQDPTSFSALLMYLIHDILMEVMVFIATLILVLMYYLSNNKSTNRHMIQMSSLEIIWTVLPLVSLSYMATPSLQILYLLEESDYPIISVKSIGHQWYWSYEYPDFNLSFDSYMNIFNNPYTFRLLDVDNRLILPFHSYSRILCTSTDVIHSWTIPSMGIKMDALPGRINQMTVYPMSMGVFFGQCSEICGMNHSFMPIATEIVSVPMFTEWISFFD